MCGHHGWPGETVAPPVAQANRFGHVTVEMAAVKENHQKLVIVKDKIAPGQYGEIGVNALRLVILGSEIEIGNVLEVAV